MSSGDERLDATRHNIYGFLPQRKDNGFYIALEFFALVRGVCELNPGMFLNPNSDGKKYRRISHDFARRVACGVLPLAALEGIMDREETLAASQALFSSLLVVSPGQNKLSNNWKTRHFFPFDGEMIHYDALERGRPPKREIIIQEEVFRGAGRWIYAALSRDSNSPRRQVVADRMQSLFETDSSALGRLFRNAATHNVKPVDSNFPDLMSSIDLHEDVSDWPERLRQGVQNIVTREQLPRTSRIRDLMHWMPYCLARHVLALAAATAEIPEPHLAVDLQRTSNQLKTQSQSQVKDFRSIFSKAHLADTPADDAREAQSSTSAMKRANKESGETAGFFTQTLFKVGALNSDGGTRNFTITPPLSAALVAAATAPGKEMNFNHFVDLIATDFKAVIGRPTLVGIKWLDRIDNGVFEKNESLFASQLRASGLLTRYSDSTSMVHREVLP